MHNFISCFSFSVSSLLLLFQHLALQLYLPLILLPYLFQVLQHQIMAGETGGTGRDLPLRAPLISLPGWDPGGPIYNENVPFLLLWDCFFSNCNSCIGGFGPFETLEDPFPRGHTGPSPPISGIISQALHQMCQSLHLSQVEVGRYNRTTTVSCILIIHDLHISTTSSISVLGFKRQFGTSDI